MLKANTPVLCVARSVKVVFVILIWITSVNIYNSVSQRMSRYQGKVVNTITENIYVEREQNRIIEPSHLGSLDYEHQYVETNSPDNIDLERLQESLSNLKVPPRTAKPVVPKLEVPKPVVPEAVVPEAVVPEAVVPEAVVPEAVVPEAVDPKVILYLITPTYYRLTQRADMLRMGYTLRQVPDVHWIVIEDAKNKSEKVEQLIKLSGHPYSHLNIESVYNKTTRGKRGCLQRNLGLEWIRNNTGPTDRGVVYFADDDNTFDIRLFQVMRKIKKVGCWPVGFVSNAPYASMQVVKGKVQGFNVNWNPRRYFAMDMAAFAINLRLIQKYPRANFYYHFGAGILESSFLRQVARRKDLEPVANNFTEVLVWHTKTEARVGKGQLPPNSPKLDF